ncbi:MAG: FAD-dependent oxidoreductase [Deltaproteobacteria bacterium]|nr:FAD-dependent oxidoreductase [Deltaproteobacteria bacterium]
MSEFPRNLDGPIIILGGGPTGLGAAYLLTVANCKDWLLYEGDDDVGGLARSFCDGNGYTWDIGGHVVFSHYDSFTRLLDKLAEPSEWLLHERESWIRILSQWVPYPFQNNIHRLPPKVAGKCLEGLIEATLKNSDRPKTNFEDFMVSVFGHGIADLFMRPYNYKVWAYPATEMVASWTGDRVATPDLKRVARNLVEATDDVSWGPNNTFRFPRFGGTGSIWQSLASRLPSEKLIMNHEAVELDIDARVIKFANGTEQKFGILISSIPLDLLVKFSRNKDMMAIASGLMRSAVNVVGVALKGAPNSELASKCWMYFPESHTPFYRVTHFSHYSPNNVPDIGKQWSLMAEISESPGKPVNHATLVDDTIKGLAMEGLIEGPKQVIHTWDFRAEYGYPTPYKGRDEILAKLLLPLERVGILSRGRFGAWLYEVGNMDHSFMQGFEAACRALFGSPEFTVWNPHVVNRPHPVLGWDRLNWRLI